MFEVKKIGNQWLIRPTGGQFRQLKIPAGACHVEVSDNFLLVDDIVYEIKASGNVAYVEKLQSIPIADGSNDSAFHSEGGAISEETWASGSHAFVEKLQGISIAEQSDKSVCYSKSNTNAECEKGSDNYLSLEMEDGQTEYDSLETGQTEETNEVEIINGEAKDLAKMSSSNTTVMFPQQWEKAKTSSNPRDTHAKFSLQYKELFEENLDLTHSTFRTADLEQKIQSIQAKLDVCCVMHSNKSQVTIYGQSKEDVRAAKTDIVSLLLPPRNNKTKSDDTFITNENIKVKVYVKDILNLPVDCIVNAANTNLDHRGGIAKAISNAAGARLNKESFDYVKNYGNLTVGSVCKTTAGNLKYKFVLHAVGPCWEFYQPYKKADIKRCEQDLYTAVLSSLCLAERHDARTVALPTISSGKYACPTEFCSVQYARAILDYSSMTKHHLSEIHIVDLNKETIEVIKHTFRVMIPGRMLPDFYKPEVYKMYDERQASYNAGDRKKTYRTNSTRVTEHSFRESTCHVDNPKSVQRNISGKFH